MNISKKLLNNAQHIKELLCVSSSKYKISSHILIRKWSSNEITLPEAEKKLDDPLMLEPCKIDLTEYAPSLRPTFNFAAYTDKSETLQQLIKLGVNLHKLEKKVGVPEFILKLDFERDIKKYIIFLTDHGVEASNLGNFITKNPRIFGEDLDYLQIRLEYLKLKKFSPVMVAKILNNNPYWLMFATERIDRRLGHFQNTFSLNGREVRKLAIIQPKLITYKMETIKLNTFAIQEEMGFQKHEVKELLLKRPKLWMIDQKQMIETFYYVHNEMKIPHKVILKFPETLFCRKARLKERHQFLEKLNKVQYDPTRENYISIKEIIQGRDVDFAVNVAKSTIDIYNTFLKTL